VGFVFNVNQYDSYADGLGNSLFLCPAIARASDTMCPLFVEAQRNVKGFQGEDWEVAVKEERIPLHHVEVFDGPVEKKDHLFLIWIRISMRYGVWEAPNRGLVRLLLRWCSHSLVQTLG